jgi:pimeloyl-ACP methyl ester carboxylesterase
VLTAFILMPFLLKPLSLFASQESNDEPNPPYPYLVEDVSFTGAQSGVTLAGTLTKPKEHGPFPAIILLAGSNSQDRDETFGTHHPLKVYADALTRHGFVVLRYDKRGCGASTGDVRSATSLDFAHDALSALTYLQTIKDVSEHDIGLLGTSEGGILTWMAASRDNRVAWIAALGSPAADHAISNQHQLVWKAEGMSDRAVSIQVALEADCMAAVFAEKDDAKAIKRMVRIVKDYRKRITDEDRKNLATTLNTVDTWGRVLLSPWWRFNLSYHAREDLGRVQCPVLALWGEHDLQASPTFNQPALEESLKSANNPDVTIKVFPGLNHAFQHSQTGAPSEYVGIRETVAPEVVQFITDWAERHAWLSKTESKH